MTVAASSLPTPAVTGASAQPSWHLGAWFSMIYLGGGLGALLFMGWSTWQAWCH